MSNSFFKKVFYVTLILGAISLALSTVLYFGWFQKPRISRDSLTFKLVTRVDEIQSYSIELQLLRLEIDTQAAFKELTSEQYSYTKSITERFPEDAEMRLKLSETELLLREAESKLANLEKREDSIKKLISVLKEYVLIACSKLKIKPKLTDKIVAGEIDGEKLIEILRDSGAIK